MQLIPRYLVSNRITIVVNETGFVTEYRPVYNRQLQVYKGIDNKIEFRVLNADQKPIDISTMTPKFVAFDETQKMILEHNGTVVTGDDSSPTRGLFQVTISENDLLNVKQQYLTYNIYLVDDNNSKSLTYSHSNFDNDATIYVNGTAFPGPLNSYSVTEFEQTGVGVDEWVSESVDAQPAINVNEALHTIAVYTESYSGDVTIQATLDNQVNQSTSWADIDVITFDGTENEPIPVNFNGVFSYLRFKATSNPADKITKILVRN